jgi:hypothetical protein
MAKFSDVGTTLAILKEVAAILIILILNHSIKIICLQFSGIRFAIKNAGNVIACRFAWADVMMLCVLQRTEILYAAQLNII